jgi:fumarate hydratase class I
MALEARVIRLARHGGSCPSRSVFLAAHTENTCKNNPEGAFLECLDKNPARFLSKCLIDKTRAAKINLDRPMPKY